MDARGNRLTLAKFIDAGQATRRVAVLDGRHALSIAGSRRPTRVFP
jgi:hypothetical protein